MVVMALLLGMAPTTQVESPSLPIESRALAAPVRELDTVNGLYPLWEQTGVLYRKWTGELGYQHAQLGLGPVQFGTSPYLDLFGTYNLDLKLKILEKPATALAFVLAGYRVPTEAESRRIGNLHAIALSNPYDPVWVFPISAALSQVLSPRLHLHATTTVLLTNAGVSSDFNVSIGQTGVLEVRASPAWRAFIHAGVEGVGVDAHGHLGLSFGYRGRVGVAKAGYARRMNFAGESAHVFLFDGGLLLP
jgi:hypothetical protein